MSRLRIEKLRRLVRVTEILYAQQVAELAKMSQARDDIALSAECARGCIDSGDAGGALFPQLTIARAARLRKQLLDCDGKLAAQLEIASSALAGLKAAASSLEDERSKVERAATERALEDIIDRVARRRETRLE